MKLVADVFIFFIFNNLSSCIKLPMYVNNVGLNPTVKVCLYLRFDENAVSVGKSYFLEKLVSY